MSWNCHARPADWLEMDASDSTPTREACDGWDVQACGALIDELWALRKSMLEHEARLAPWLREADPAHVASAVNLAHYLAMRRFDMRRLQERLAGIGVSSLGRAEAHVLANLDKVIGILHRLAGRRWTPMTQDEPAGRRHGRALLDQHAQVLFGALPAERGVRIMVTLPGEAAHDDALVDGLVAAGMDIARINCAHDGAAEWQAMAARVRKAARRAGRPVRVLMDLAGPKLRTGPIADGVAVLKLKPQRDAFGGVTAPARLGLRAVGSSATVQGATAHVGVDTEWLERLDEGDRIDVTDARSAHRRLTVVARLPGGVLVECGRTAYLTGETRLRLHRRGHGVHDTVLGDLPAPPGRIRLQRGETLRLVAQGLGHSAVVDPTRQRTQPATVACTLPEALTQVRKGERVWFDDGRIGAVVRRKRATGVEVGITHAREGGEDLAADKGINLPDTQLKLPALTAKDIEDLGVVARHADLAGLSFAQSAADVRELRQRLVDLGAAHLGIILKIETRRGFEHLPEMLFAAMECPAAGVMIARGDLAVECGYERLAEVQEEILWACEAAHMPAVWATQVLETLAKTGLPTRAEITDAAMGERAECVMLNKGPHILDAMRTLDDILRRMQAHQSKKRPLMRALKAWSTSLEAVERASPARPVDAKSPKPSPTSNPSNRGQDRERRHVRAKVADLEPVSS
jgi:pyruvate kinase